MEVFDFYNDTSMDNLIEMESVLPDPFDMENWLWEKEPVEKMLTI